jgi:hypothetical protein
MKLEETFYLLSMMSSMVGVALLAAIVFGAFIPGCVFIALGFVIKAAADNKTAMSATRLRLAGQKRDLEQIKEVLEEKP